MFRWQAQGSTRDPNVVVIIHSETVCVKKQLVDVFCWSIVKVLLLMELVEGLLERRFQVLACYCSVASASRGGDIEGSDAFVSVLLAAAAAALEAQTFL